MWGWRRRSNHPFSVDLRRSDEDSFKGPACKIGHHLMVGWQTAGDGDLNAHIWSETRSQLLLAQAQVSGWNHNFFHGGAWMSAPYRNVFLSDFYLIWHIRVHFLFHFMHRQCWSLWNVPHWAFYILEIPLMQHWNVAATSAKLTSASLQILQWDGRAGNN